MTARTHEAREARRYKVRARVASPGDNLPARCSIIGCGRPTQRASGKGLSALLCRSHQAHDARHGSPWHPSYSAAELRPYLKATAGWLKAHWADAWVTHDVSAVAALLAASGRAVPSTSLRGRSPKERARIAMARLRDAGIEPSRIVAIALAVHACEREDPVRPRTREFRQVQIAKVLHRISKPDFRHQYEWPLPGGERGIVTVAAHARSTGQVLRHLGKAIEEACDHVLARFVPDVLAAKIERHGPHPGMSAIKLSGAGRLSP
jgi:hypothetical protein